MLDIVLCCNDEPEELVAEAVRSLQIPRFRQRIAIACNGSRDYSHLAEGQHLDAVLRASWNGGIGQLRNLGVRWRRAPLVMFVDGHMIIQDWATALPLILEAFERHSDLGILTGLYKASGDGLGARARDLQYRGLSGKTSLGGLVLSKHQWITITGGLSVFRADIFAAAGIFPMSYRSSACEDIFVQLRANALGWTAGLLPQLRAEHHHPMSLWRYYATVAHRNPRGSARLLVSMILRECPPKLSGYVCELPAWSLFLWASAPVALFVHPVLGLSTAVWGLVGLSARCQSMAVTSRSRLELLHASLGYAIDKLLKVPWFGVACLERILMPLAGARRGRPKHDDDIAGAHRQSAPL